MNSWKARLMALLVAVAMLIVVQGPVMADDFDDCEFVGFDGFGNAVFVCDFDFDDDDFFFFDEDFDGIDDFFDNCIGAEFGGECIGVG